MQHALGVEEIAHRGDLRAHLFAELVERDPGARAIARGAGMVPHRLFETAGCAMLRLDLREQVGSYCEERVGGLSSERHQVAARMSGKKIPFTIP